MEALSQQSKLDMEAALQSNQGFFERRLQQQEQASAATSAELSEMADRSKTLARSNSELLRTETRYREQARSRAGAGASACARARQGCAAPSGTL